MVPSGVCDCCFGYSSEQCALIHGGYSDHIEALWCAHEHCDIEVTWEDRLWNEEDQVLELRICYSCLGTTSAECAEHGGSCLNGDAAPQGRQLWSRSPGVENGWTMDTVVTNTAQFANTQLPLALQEEQPPVSQDQVSTQRYLSSTSNRADIFTVPSSSFRDLRVVLNGFLSRAQQYCFVKQSASPGRWWTGILGAANTVHFALSGRCRHQVR